MVGQEPGEEIMELIAFVFFCLTISQIIYKRLIKLLKEEGCVVEYNNDGSFYIGTKIKKWFVWAGAGRSAGYCIFCFFIVRFIFIIYPIDKIVARFLLYLH